MVNAKVVTLLGLALAFFLIATNVQAGLLYLVSASLIGLVIVSYGTPTFVLRGLRLSRLLPAEVFEGTPVSIKTTVLNTGRLSRFLVKVEDEIANGSGGVCTWLPGGGQETLVYDAFLPRGVFPTAPLTVVSGTPFGIWHKKRSIDTGAGITVFPAYEEISTFPLLEAMSSPSETVHERRSAGFGYDYLGIREYRRGDSMRVVHWRSSAKRGELVVKEFEEEFSTPVSLLIDLKSGSVYGPAGESTLDATARVAATLANYCLKAGHPLRIFASGRDGLIMVERPSFYPVLEWLAGLQADGRLEVDDLVEESIQHISQRSTVVLITNTQEADWAGLAAAAQARRARLIIILIDTKSFGESKAPRLADIAGSLPGARVTFYGLRKGQDIRECLREPLNVTGK